MANVTNIQILEDGPRNVVVKLDGILDTSDITSTTLVDPALLSPIDAAGTLPTRLIIDKISYNMEQGLAANLYWDATTPVLIASMVSSGDDLEFKKFGGIYNNAGAGVTGKITYTTQGWSAGAILSFNVILEMRKK